MDGVNTKTLFSIEALTAGNISGGTQPYGYKLDGQFQVVGGPPSVQDAGIVQIPLDVQLVGSTAATVLQETYTNGVSAVVI